MAWPAPGPDSLRADLDATLPYELTAGQARVGEDLARVLESTVPMQVLLQGDVGSGKTLVALRAMAQVVGAGGQAALLAPTEVLAAQHRTSLEALLGISKAFFIEFGGEYFLFLILREPSALYISSTYISRI